MNILSWRRSLCDCSTSGPGRWWCPGTWMTPLQSQCCSWWWMGESWGFSPEVHDHLHCFERVQLQVKTAPDSHLLNLLSVSRLVTILDEADQCGVICKLQELDRGGFRCAVVCVCTGRRAAGREHSPEELQCWSYGCWMCIFPASLACLSGSCWSTDRWTWAQRAELVWAGGGLGW